MKTYKYLLGNTQIASAIAALIIIVPIVSAARLDLIPKPAEVEIKKGSFLVNGKTSISFDRHDKSLQKTATYLREMLGKGLSIDLETVGNDKNCVFLEKIDAPELGSEGYRLEITPEHIKIQAPTAAGIFYGVQTIRQLLPPEIEEHDGSKEIISLPCLVIEDRPRYSWRGLMLDESRHFFGKEIVKDLLDQMAFYKLNRFHWHLTDSPGWRIEIEGYPKLTTIGARGNKNDPNAAPKFYTQQEIREIVDYAAVRHITIVPEIDMPGHAAAANRAYPEFSGGGSQRHPEFTFNPAKPETVEFLQDVLKQVAELFPGKWIHYGGDEVHFANKQWADDKYVQQLMEEKNLKDIVAVEQYFNRRMSAFINSLGKTTMGWDEIVDAGVPADECVILWWRHNKPGQRDKAIERGYHVVLCPRRPLYFDFVQHDSHKVGRRWGGFCPLDMVYNYPQLPDSYSQEEKQQIMGLQANLWTERIWNEDRLDFMTFPRIAALAESSWTEHGNKDYSRFLQALKGHLKRYEIWDIYYFNPFDPDAHPEPRR